MNVVQFPIRTRGPLKMGEVREITGSGADGFIESGRVTIYNGSHYESPYLLRDEAIEAAKAILIAYDVPFCNHVTPEEAS